MEIREVTIKDQSVSVEIEEVRQGHTVGDDGYQNEVHVDAGIGWEVDDNGKRTGRRVAWYSESPEGAEFVGEGDGIESLDDYLKCFDSEYIETFHEYNLLEK